MSITKSIFLIRIGKLLWSYETSDNSLFSKDITLDGRYIVVGSYKRVYLFDQNGKLLWSYKTDGRTVSVISSNERYIVAGSTSSLFLFDNAKCLLSSVENTISRAKSVGLNPLKAEKTLNQAKEKFSNGNYNKAIELAKSVLLNKNQSN